MGGGGEGIPLNRFLGTIHIAYDEWGPQSRVMQAEALVWAERLCVSCKGCHWKDLEEVALFGD